MTLSQLLGHLAEKQIQLSVVGDELIIRGKKKLLDSNLLAQLRDNKQALLDLLRIENTESQNSIARGAASSETPFLPELTREEYEQVVQSVPGNAANVQDIYPLTPLQQGILFHHLASGEGDPYLLSTLVSFDSRERLDAYVTAMQAVVDRHDVLRTAVLWENLPEPVQVVWRKAPLRIEEIELDAGGDAAEQLYARYDPRHFRIDVRQAPLLRLYISYDREKNRWLLFTLLHHLAGDHTTLEVIQEEIRAHLLGQVEHLPAVLPFRNLVMQARLGVSKEEHETFFRKMLGDVEEPTTPFGLIDVQEDGKEIEQARVLLDPGLARRIREQARRLGVSAASLSHVAWGRVLAKVTGRQDVVFGTVLFGRMQGEAGMDRAVGLFINTLPIRIQVGEEGVKASVLRMHKLLADLMRHEHASLAEAQRCSRVPAPAPLFSALLNYRHGAAAARSRSAEAKQAWAGIKLLRREERTNYPVTLSVDDLDEGFGLNAQTPTWVGPMRICEFMRTALESLIDALETSPLKAVSAVDVLPAWERQQVLYGWNETKAEYEREASIQELFEEQVKKRPEAVAVVYGEESVSYGELNERANRLGQYLRGLGVKPDLRVAVCLERSVEMVVGLLGVLKAGGAYVPLDPGYPAERLRYMVEDSEPMALLTESHLREQFSGMCEGLPVLDLKEEAWRWEREDGRNGEGKGMGVTGRHLAYVIYTSGSTGQPKGVAVEHRGVTNRLIWMQKAYGLKDEDGVLQKTPFSFDVSVWEFFWPLVAGARLVMARPEGHKDPGYLVEAIRENEITTIHFVPSMLEAFLGEGGVEGCSTLERIVCSGEALSARLVRRCREGLPEAGLHNLYGPTEATVDVTAWSCPAEIPETTIPIGKPIANTQIYILDGEREPVPVGVAGEMYIGGVGVARGYLNRAELTAERFMKDPFVAEPDGRMYKTGDLGRWQRDGNIEFLGRNDDQVKIRGFRIELGEIEARLREHEGIGEAVVVAREDGGGEKRLAAYYTRRRRKEKEGKEGKEEEKKRGEERLGAEELRGYLKERVPEYMVPSAYVELEAMPLTVNGKVDRKALPEPEADSYGVREYEEPEGKTELTLAVIWRQLLKVERVGRQDNFFFLGGHSLLAVRMITRVRQALGVEVTIRDVFGHPVLADLASVLEKTVQAALPPITRAERKGRLPLSFAQQRLWFLAQMEGVSEAYHIGLGVRLQGELDGGTLRRALNRIVERHEALRTRFVVVEGEPQQQITAAEESSFDLMEQDLRGCEDAEGELKRISEEEGTTSFNLEQGPLIRGRLLRLTDREHVLLLTMHHIVSDGWSLGILRKELSALYAAYVRGEEDPLPELAIQYADYAVWQRQWMEGEILQEQKEYWKRTLRGAPGLLELPMDHPRPTQQSYAGEVERLVVDEALTAGLRELSRKEGTTLYMTVLAAWAALLVRLSGQTEVVIGTPTANRGRAEIENLIGFFVNTVALRVEITGGMAVRELLARVKTQALEAQQHQDITFEQVVELMQPERSLSHSPIFQTMFAWQTREDGKLELPGLQPVALGWSRYRVAKFDITVSLQETEQKIVGGIEYATSLFERATIQRYLGYMRRLLEGMVANEKEEMLRLSMLPAWERQQVLYGWNETKAEYEREASIQELFEEQVKKRPEAVAVVYGEESVSYGELNERANRLGQYLRGLGVKPDLRVAVCLERSVEMVVGLLGVLKAGGAYVPLDPGYPAERLRYMVEDSGPMALLTESHLREQFSGMCEGLPVLDLKEEAWRWEREDGRNGEGKGMGVTGRHLAYVIYTSGSTGQPKGVAVEHRGVTNRLIWMQKAYGLKDEDGVLQKTPFSFDVSVWEFFWPLVAGARLVMARPEGHKDPGYLVEAIRENEITTIHFVPSMLEAFLGEGGVEGCSTLERIVCSGEALSARLVRRCREGLPEAGLHNLYGPTEATVDVTAWSCPAEIPETTIPIGKPIANTQIYILDGEREPVPVGVAGEMYIGGVGVARGYLNRAELTAERFMKDPFVAEPDGRMYKTGDLGRWQRDGNIEFLGRNDDQVKIRGFRIELGEIEARLREHEGIGEAVVVAREDGGGEKRLAAYYTRRRRKEKEGKEGKEEEKKRGEERLGAEELRGYLKERVPEYMVPSAYVVLEAMPLTVNGKVDRKALPEPEVEVRRAWRGARTPEEEILCGLFGEVLGVERVGVDDNFFELGGHSLMATRLVSRIRGALGVEIAMRRLFERPTVGELGKVLRGGEEERRPRLERGGRPEKLPLSYAQQRLWFIDQLEGGSAEYNMVQGLELKGELDEGALERAIQTIVGRHESLRTRFEEIGGEARQEIEKESGIEMEVEDLRGWEEREKQERVREVMRREGREAFDLRRGPVLRVKLLRLGEEEHVLVRTMHHIVSDGWSEGIFNHELVVLYEAYREGGENPLKPLGVQYGDFAVWQRKWLEGGAMERGVGYWKEELAGIPERLELARDGARGERQTFGAEVCQAMLSVEQVEGLKGLSREHEATLYMTMLGVFGVLLWRYSGQEDIVVGSPIANRQEEQLEELIGFFVNTLVLRMRVRGEGSFGELLREVRRTALGAYQHQDVPFERLVEELSPERKLNTTPVFQVVFDLQNAPVDEGGMKGLEVKGLGKGELQVRYDLEMHVREQGGRMRMYVVYNRELFEKWRMEQMVRHYVRMLESVVEEGGRARVGRVEMLSEEEREQVLYGWNRTERELGARESVHELVEEEARKRPEAVAVVYGEESVSYGELNRRANRLARYLVGSGVGRETRVGVCLERSVEMVAVLLGILKCGGAYVPLDGEYPAERLEYMIEDGGVGLIVTEKGLRERLPVQGSWFVGMVCIDEEGEKERIGEEGGENLGLEIEGRELAYVMYTSGSTGRPKGVGVEHRAIRRLVCNGGYVEWKSEDVMLQMAPVSFDASTFEIWGALSNGLALVVAPAGRLSLEEVGRTVVRHGVTVMWLTAALFHAMVDERKEELVGVRQLLAGGDVLSREHVREYLKQQREGWLINGYGPTEATTFSCCNRMERLEERRKSIPIGVPIGNTQAYIVDGDLEPMGIGVAGEICIGGMGLARGYWKRPELTAERFVPNPYRGEGERMYRTGDMGRWRIEGNIEFIGRNDDQVKIRGFRIELGEIEARLRQHEGVGEAVVVMREDGEAGKRLVAYYTRKKRKEGEKERLEAEELRGYLKARLPEYMAPSTYVEMESLPLTANGKVDRKALPLSEEMALDAKSYVEPRNSIERILAKIWCEALKVQQVGIRDNFFQLGGDSILILRIMGRAKERGLKFSLQDVFEHQTIETLARVTTREEGKAHVVTVPFELVGEDVRRLLPTEIEDAYPLTWLQLGMLFHSAYAPDSGVYHDVISYRLHVPYDAEKFQATIDYLTQRHEVLRAAINMTAFSQPLQLIHPQVHLKVVEQDWRFKSVVEQKMGLRDFIDLESKSTFELTQPPLLRIFVHRLNDDEFQCSLSFHHAILDGWSEASLITELLQNYKLRLTDSVLEVEPTNVNYRDYIALEQQAMTSVETQAFWKQLLKGHSVTPVPLRDWRGDQKPANSDVIQSQAIEINEATCDQLQNLAKELGVPLKTVLLAAHMKALQLLTGDSDVTTGVVLNGRPEIDSAEQILGLFLNTVPFRLSLDCNTWKLFIRETFENEQRILPHRRYPMAALREQMGRKALFETVFNFMHFHIYKELGAEGPRLAGERSGYARTNFDFIVHFRVSVETGKINGIVECDTGAMGAAALKRVAQYYGRILTRMTEHQIGDLRFEEEQTEIEKWNETGVEYGREASIQELFEEQVEKRPEAVAVVYGEESLSYGELNRRANRLAHYLQGLGVKPDARVAVCVERSLELVVAVLGVLKAGGAYVPLDPEYPKERLRYMLEDSAPVAVLTEGQLREQFSETCNGVPVLDLKEEAWQWESLTATNPDGRGDRGGDLAYVIYTSGSTGEPKGVMVEHRSVNRLVKGVEYVRLGEEERVMQMAPVSFDAATFEMWGALLNGGQLIVMEAGRRTLREIGQGMEEREITVAWLTGPLFHLMVETELEGMKRVKQLVAGGDVLDPERVRRYREKIGEGEEEGQVIVNGYGPTEGTTFTCCYRMEGIKGGRKEGKEEKEEKEGKEEKEQEEQKQEERAIPIGKPIGNTQVYILNAHLEAAPVGVAGEMYIGGAGVARGYQNRAELTAERFVPNPFAGSGGERMYRTGDLGRWQRDGNIEFLGRNDDQVKIRGFRVELAEIETRLREHEGIGEAVVVAREDGGGEKRLVAYYTRKREKGERLGAEELRAHLQERVPEYMVPSAYVVLEAMPLTVNGKVDRKTLPAPEVESVWKYEEPVGETETALAAIWTELLQVERVGRQDDFFLLGGHSLLAVRLITRVQQVLGVEVGIGDVFTHPILSSLAGRIVDIQLEQFNAADIQTLMKTFEKL